MLHTLTLSCLRIKLILWFNFLQEFIIILDENHFTFLLFCPLPPSLFPFLPPPSSPGPFGEGDDEQVFIQRVIPDTDTIFVHLSSTGDRWG